LTITGSANWAEWVSACFAVATGWPAHRLRNSYKAFSSVLVGVLAVFYFTVTFGLSKLPTVQSISGLCDTGGVTSFAVCFLLYDRQELASFPDRAFVSPFFL